MKVFSFCLYGTDANYYTGLLENIQLIREHYPEFEIFVYKGICDPSWVLDGVHVEETGKEGAINMMHRYLPLGFADIGFVRDADSRITERDRWCINQFLASDKPYHIIRDHIWHKSKIMGGMFGWKKPIDVGDISGVESQYGADEKYIADILYPQIVSDALVHTNLVAFHREEAMPILLPQKDPTDFVGNVIWDGIPKFTSFYDISERVAFLQGQDQFGILKYLSDNLNPLSIPYEKRSLVYDALYIANYYMDDIPKAQFWLEQFEFAEVTDHIVYNSQYLIPHIAPRLVASFDPERIPLENEVVVVYGNYPIWHHALPYSNTMFRHVSLFSSLKHDVVEYHPCWESVGTIYILNLEERVDRFYETMLALCAVRAPLHRVFHYKAKKGDLPPYVGATKNHVDVMKMFCAKSDEVCLVLEDDFVFLDDRNHVWSSIAELFANPVDFNICFLSLSKNGVRLPHNSLLSKTLQPCTTSSGYFLQKSTAPDVCNTAAEGLELMQRTGNHHDFCIDRYWAKLPKLFFFRKKLGFQRPAYSNLIGGVVAHLD